MTVTLNVSWLLKNCWSTGIFPHGHLWFTENDVKKRKYPVCLRSVEENASLSEVREWSDCFE